VLHSFPTRRSSDLQPIVAPLPPMQKPVPQE
jgi:hypothetical protein